MPTPSSRCSGPKSAKVTSAAEIGSLKVAAAKGTTQELALSAMAPKATIMRTEDDATAAAAYVSGQAELFATNSLIIPDLQKRNPSKEFELKFTIRRSPAHMGVRMGEHNLVRWLDSFIFFNMMNGEIDRLHQKWLGIPHAPDADARKTIAMSRNRLVEAEGLGDQGARPAQRHRDRPIGATEQHGPHLPEHGRLALRPRGVASRRAHHGEDHAGGGGTDHPLRHVRASHVAQRHHHARLCHHVRRDPLRGRPRRSAMASSASSRERPWRQHDGAAQHDRRADRRVQTAASPPAPTGTSP